MVVSVSLSSVVYNVFMWLKVAKKLSEQANRVIRPLTETARGS